jgi:hypothetical protein
MALSEAEFQSQVIDLAHRYGWFVSHQRPAQIAGRWMTPVQGDAGAPDLLLAHPRFGVRLVELKTDTGRLSPEQVKWGKAIEGSTNLYRIWRPSDLAEIVSTLAGRQ